MRAYHVLLPPGTRPPCRFEAMLAKEGGFGNKAAALYAQLDKDGDGQLTAEELKQVRQHSPVGLSRGPPPWASPVGLSREPLRGSGSWTARAAASQPTRNRTRKNSPTPAHVCPDIPIECARPLTAVQLKFAAQGGHAR